jgi:hypothetical protein
MKILERHKSWIHTYFLTDCTRLPAHRVREVGSRMGAFLRSLGIVFGVHVEEHKGEPGLRIVLECIPFPDTLELIQAELQRIVEPIPAKPRTVAAIRFVAPEPLENGEGEERNSHLSGSQRTPPARDSVQRELGSIREVGHEKR